MTAEHVFSAANLIAMVGWLILIVGARRRWAAPLVTGAILPLLFAVLYGLLIATHWARRRAALVRSGKFTHCFRMIGYSLPGGCTCRSPIIRLDPNLLLIRECATLCPFGDSIVTSCYERLLFAAAILGLIRTIRY